VALDVLELDGAIEIARESIEGGCGLVRSRDTIDKKRRHGCSKSVKRGFPHP